MIDIKKPYLHLIVLIFIETVYCWLSVILFQFIIFFTLGSGAGADTYLEIQKALWVFLILGIPSVINIFQYYRHRKKSNKREANNYLILQLWVIVVFSIIVLYYS